MKEFLIDNDYTDELDRPFSPQLEIYQEQIGSAMSIFSRITGIILLITFMILQGLYTISNVGLTYHWVYSLIFFFFKADFTNPWFAFFAYFVGTSALYHVFASVRHLVWFSSGKVFYMKELRLHPVAIKLVTVLKWTIFIEALALLIYYFTS